VYSVSCCAGPPVFQNNIFENNAQSTLASILVYFIFDRLRMVDRGRPVASGFRFTDRETRTAQSATHAAAESKNEFAKTHNRRIIAALKSRHPGRDHLGHASEPSPVA